MSLTPRSLLSGRHAPREGDDSSPRARVPKRRVCLARGHRRAVFPRPERARDVAVVDLCRGGRGPCLVASPPEHAAPRRAQRAVDLEWGAGWVAGRVVVWRAVRVCVSEYGPVFVVRRAMSL